MEWNDVKGKIFKGIGWEDAFMPVLLISGSGLMIVLYYVSRKKTCELTRMGHYFPFQDTTYTNKNIKLYKKLALRSAYKKYLRELGPEVIKNFIERTSR